jgi:hypothetical protein
MRFCITALLAAAVFFLWTSWYSNSTAVASSGFTGSWCGNSRNAYMITDFPQFVVKQGISVVTSAHYALNGAQLVAERWGQTATLSSDRNKLHWSDGSVWTRAIYGTQYCATFGSAAAPAPSYRDLTLDHVAPPRADRVLERLDRHEQQQQRGSHVRLLQKRTRRHRYPRALRSFTEGSQWRDRRHGQDRPKGDVFAEH